MRKIILGFHLSLALALGVLFSLQGVSGSLITFYREFDQFLNPHVVIQNPGGERKSIQELFEVVRSAHPTRTGPWKLVLPEEPDQPFRADYQKPKEKEGKFWAPLMISVNPYTGEIIDTRFWGDTLMTWVYDVHAELQMDKFGWDLVGYLALGWLVSFGTGLYLGSPRGFRFPRQLWFKKNPSNSRLLYDGHRLVGLYFSLPLIILAVSGFYFVHPTKVKPVVALFSSIYEKPSGLLSTGGTLQQSITLDRAAEIAGRHFSNGRVYKIITPGSKKDGVFEITVWQPESYSRHHPLSTVWLDQYSGKLLSINDRTKGSLGQFSLDLLWPLHREIQEFAGMPGRILYFVSGFVPLFLLITGVRFYRAKKKLTREKAKL
ncbi:MAG: PepSY domain-containing protein [Candidatus Nitronauta litoralis]|uniref:PepSY domain-containing protein n=1 Tax=Candidatus Nitronauta litoralis TaxID=2705533 RepID=A0A7T0BXM1_9BACT|nr:MAG: PepSY domain-containing protein [Candidatus Nitronauta litoralis]